MFTSYTVSIGAHCYTSLYGSRGYERIHLYCALDIVTIHIQEEVNPPVLSSEDGRGECVQDGEGGYNEIVILRTALQPSSDISIQGIELERGYSTLC